MVNGSTGLHQLIFAFHRIYHSCLRRELESRGLQEIGNPSVLFILYHMGSDESVSQKEIADRIGIAPPTVAISLKRMERSGLVIRESDDQDLRRNAIRLTEKGVALTKDCIQAERDVYRRLVSDFTPEDVEALRQYHLRMIQNLGDMDIRRPRFCEKGEETI